MKDEGEFFQLVEKARGGVLQADLNAQIRDLLGKIQETGKEGKIALELRFKPAGQGRVEVSTAIKSSVPQPTTESTLFYITGEGRLSRRDPRQPELPALRTVEGGA